MFAYLSSLGIDRTRRFYTKAFGKDRPKGLHLPPPYSTSVSLFQALYKNSISRLSCPLYPVPAGTIAFFFFTHFFCIASNDTSSCATCITSKKRGCHCRASTGFHFLSFPFGLACFTSSSIQDLATTLFVVLFLTNSVFAALRSRKMYSKTRTLRPSVIRFDVKCTGVPRYFRRIIS